MLIFPVPSQFFVRRGVFQSRDYAKNVRYMCNKHTCTRCFKHIGVFIRSVSAFKTEYACEKPKQEWKIRRYCVINGIRRVSLPQMRRTMWRRRVFGKSNFFSVLKTKKIRLVSNWRQIPPRGSGFGIQCKQDRVNYLRWGCSFQRLCILITRLRHFETRVVVKNMTTAS
jgi:hypothetical protein